METDPNAGIIDSAGGHATSCTGTCPVRVASVHGSGYRCLAEPVEVAYTPDLDTSAGYTAAAWVNVSSVTGQASPFFKPIFEPGDMFFDSDDAGARATGSTGRCS